MKTKMKNAKLMSQCHKNITRPVKSRLFACDKGYGKPCHTMSHVTKKSARKEEARCGSNEGKTPLGVVPYTEKSLEVKAV